MTTRPLVALLLLIHAGLLMWSGYSHSPGTDEPGHLVAGIAIWQKGRYDLYRVNPPLVKMVAAAPVVLAGAETEWRNWSDRPGVRSAWQVGRDFMRVNGQQIRWYFALARWACIPICLLGAYVCFRWASEMYGDRAGILALALWCFSPDILGNGAMITPDVGAASFGILAGYQFWKWVRCLTMSSTLLAGLTLGLALLTKSTWIILFPLWPSLWFLSRLTKPTTSWLWLRECRSLFFIMLLGLGILNLGYLFTGSYQRLGDYRFFSSTLAGAQNFSQDRSESGNRFHGTLLGQLPVPMPRDFVEGLDLQKHDFEAGKWCYLAGKHQFGGWWYFYVYALIVKLPIGVWLLTLLALWLRITRSVSFSVVDEALLLLPAVAILAIVSMQTGFTIYLRYLLPAYPLVFIWISSTSLTLQTGTRPVLRWITVVSVFWFANSSLAYFPHSLSYFNEFAGGPQSGHDHLLDGNIDWGQDFWELKHWRHSNPTARPFFLAFYGQTNPSRFGLSAQFPPRAPRELTDGEFASLRRRLQAGPTRDSTDNSAEFSADDRWLAPGWYAISVNVLRGYRTRVFASTNVRLSTEPYWFSYFRAMDPIDRIGYSINIYHVTENAAEEIGRAYGIETTSSDEDLGIPLTVNPP